MKIITSLEQLKIAELAPSVAALGTFDGLHIGHQDVITTAKAYAVKHGLALLVFTFSNHPLSKIMPELVPKSLIDNGAKEQIMQQLGVDVLINVPFTTELAQISPEGFLKLLQDNKVQAVAVGENYSYGSGGYGNTASLRQEGSQNNLAVMVRPLIKLDGLIVSSTNIRNFISEGKIRMANRMLGRHYSITGKVMHGEKRGRTMGFPTANLELNNAGNVAIPAAGVYAGQVEVSGKVYPALVNVGNNPTFSGQSLRLEAHLLHFKGDLYNTRLKVEFLAFMRPEQRFPDMQALQRQIAKDALAVKKFF